MPAPSGDLDRAHLTPKQLRRMGNAHGLALVRARPVPGRIPRGWAVAPRAPNTRLMTWRPGQGRMSAKSRRLPRRSRSPPSGRRPPGRSPRLAYEPERPLRGVVDIDADHHDPSVTRDEESGQLRGLLLACRRPGGEEVDYHRAAGGR